MPSFNSKPNTESAVQGPSTPATPRGNGFAAANETPDQLLILGDKKKGVDGKHTLLVQVDAFRVVEAQPKAQIGLSVYIDFTIKYVQHTDKPTIVAVGKKMSHRVNGFDSAYPDKAFRQLWALECALLANDGLTPEDTETDRSKLPYQIAEEGLAKGKYLWIDGFMVGKEPNLKLVANYGTPSAEDLAEI